MKFVTRLAALVAVLGAVGMLASCGGDTPFNPQLQSNGQLFGPITTNNGATGASGATGIGR